MCFILLMRFILFMRFKGRVCGETAKRVRVWSPHYTVDRALVRVEVNHVCGPLSPRRLWPGRLPALFPFRQVVT
jgi:hypothetical protein